MGKKRDRANQNIQTLINELVSYEESYIGCNCPYKMSLFGADNISKPLSCSNVGCESCKEDFFIQVNDNLGKRFIVE